MIKNFLFSFLICFSICSFQLPIHADSVKNEDLITLLQFADENNDEALLRDVINALLDTKRDGGYDIMLAISKYNNAGKLDFAVHDAIQANDLVAALILAYYSKDINKRLEWERVWTNQNGSSKSGFSREGKNPLELAFWLDMKTLIPFLINRGADIYQMRQCGFVFKGEEELDFVKEIFPDGLIYKRSCITTKKEIIATSRNFKRNFIGDAIAKNRLDIIEMIGNKSVDWNKPCLVFGQNNGLPYTPLQYALLMKRDDITLYLIMHGAFIK